MSTIGLGLSRIAKKLVASDAAYSFSAWAFLFIYRFYCLFKYRYPDFFWSLGIEISTDCNRRCYYCPNIEHGTPDEYMPDELFRRIIQNLKDIEYSGAVSYQFYGEPLLDKRLVDFIRYTKENLPKAMFIKVISNGDYLTPELLERLIDAGMTEISITIHDPDSTSMMKRLQPMINRHPSHTRVNSIQGSKHLSNRGGAIDIENEARKKRCPWTGNAVVDYNGNILLCCNDYFHAYKFGNVKEERMEDIWKKKDFERFRKSARKGRPELEICKKCLGLNYTKSSNSLL